MATDDAGQIVRDLAALDPLTGEGCALCGASGVGRFARDGRSYTDTSPLTRPSAHRPTCPWARAVDLERSTV